jgi:hypothetical protein
MNLLQCNGMVNIDGSEVVKDLNSRQSHFTK